MSEPHRMTLRPPWEALPLPDGRTRHRRRFGRPRTLGEGETVWLVGEADATAEVWLNGERIATGAFAVEVTARLAARNEVWVDTAAAMGKVAVEVRVGEPAT